MEFFALNSFAAMLVAAFIGGLILNVMPCVLPVLALKLYALNQEPNKQSLWLIAGIVLAFNVFALLIYILQQGGNVIGWGFHFQQPIFVLFMMSLLLFFVFMQAGKLQLNLGLETFSNKMLDRFSSNTALSNLFYGAVIVLLATPCTAPFLGSAVAFALTQGLLTISAIFTSIALGLSLPWIVFMFFPRFIESAIALIRRRDISKFFYYFVAALLYGSALWLLYVLSSQIGLLAAVGAFVAIHFILFFWQKIVLAPAFLALVIALPLILPEPEIIIKTETLKWHTFNESKIKTQQALGKKVFVDITAAWCITCQYNKANVLLDEEVQQRLSQRDIYLMRGDLTKPNKVITNFIKSHQRIGIPFNALYTKGSVYLFSEILDKKTLLVKLNN